MSSVSDIATCIKLGPSSPSVCHSWYSSNGQRPGKCSPQPVQLRIVQAPQDQSYPSHQQGGEANIHVHTSLHVFIHTCALTHTAYLHNGPCLKSSLCYISLHRCHKHSRLCMSTHVPSHLYISIHAYACPFTTICNHSCYAHPLMPTVMLLHVHLCLCMSIHTYTCPFSPMSIHSCL